MLLKSRLRTHHPTMLLLYWKYVSTHFPSIIIQKYSTLILRVNTKNIHVSHLASLKINAPSSYCDSSCKILLQGRDTGWSLEKIYMKNDGQVSTDKKKKKRKEKKRESCSLDPLHPSIPYKRKIIFKGSIVELGFPPFPSTTHILHHIEPQKHPHTYTS